MFLNKIYCLKKKHLQEKNLQALKMNFKTLIMIRTQLTYKLNSNLSMDCAESYYHYMKKKNRIQLMDLVKTFLNFVVLKIGFLYQ